ncbi:hypothetical protein [Streptomyces sp. NBC_00162]|uniref:hypothetical protein n=1 Tax=Streptomyces sp. NBC_00162 TaxID=2903629 RepID=UPI00214AB9B4|nr:hypothetical protein [Streptomyces sp. NBC_00162]UUU37942.1 hypothetical protein JIW86_03105 [Streptomyces sp. NBC_00162]
MTDNNTESTGSAEQPTTVPLAPPVPAPQESGRTAKGLPRWALPVATGLAGLLLGSGITYLASSGSEDEPRPEKGPATFQMGGSMKISGDYKSVSKDYGGGCSGVGGYKDIRAGAQVNVYDSAGRVLATGSLDKGAATESKTGTVTVCTFPVIVNDVPTGAGLYQVEVSHRGKLSISEADAVTGTFAASL